MRKIYRTGFHKLILPITLINFLRMRKIPGAAGILRPSFVHFIAPT